MGLLSTTDLAIFSVSLSVQQKPTSLKQCSIKKAIFPWSSGFLANIINRYGKHPSAYLYHTCVRVHVHVYVHMHVRVHVHVLVLVFEWPGVALTVAWHDHFACLIKT